MTDGWGRTPPWSIGLEEEVMLVDARTFDLVPAGPDLVADAESLDLPGRLKTELFAAVVELNTVESSTVEEAFDAVRRLRSAAAELAERRGLRLLAAGSHPVARPETQEIVDEPRYTDFVAYAGISARRQGVNGLHVHVSMPSSEACFHALEGILPWLPVILALSANSPYLGGEETGLASNRAEILAELPRTGAPPAFASYGEWEVFVERFVRLGISSDYTRFWWDVRPHPRFGTLEVRMPDQPTAVGLTGSFAALVQALCATVLDEPARPFDPGARGVYHQNRWAASRFGPGAELIHPDGERAARVPELARELVELVAPAAEHLGSAELLAALPTDRCEGEQQLAIGRRDGLAAVCADLLERSVR